MYEPWPFQHDAITASLSFLRRPGDGVMGEHGLVVLPTGSGKSLVIANVASKLDAPSIIFQPSREILEQNATKIAAYGFDPAIYSASFGKKEVGEITLATIGSVKKVPEAFADVRYALVDECHTVNAEAGMYIDFLQQLGNIRMLGFTASPFRLKRDAAGSQLKFLTRTRPKVFGEMVHFEQIGELMDAGYLCRPEYQRVDGFMRSAVKANSSGGDYDEAELQRYFNATNFDDRLVRVVKRLFAVGRRRVLVFCTSVAQAAMLAAAVGGRVLSADTPAHERKEIVAGFRAGIIECVSTVGVLSTGFDYPELDTVVCARPTLSLAVYYQQVGRLMRRFAGKDAWLIDMVDHLGMFGKIEDLVLQAGGKRGQSWEFVSNGKPLTNTYFAQPDEKRQAKNRSFAGRNRAGGNPWAQRRRTS